MKSHLEVFQAEICLHLALGKSSWLQIDIFLSFSPENKIWFFMKCQILFPGEK